MDQRVVLILALLGLTALLASQPPAAGSGKHPGITGGIPPVLSAGGCLGCGGCAGGCR
jgi:hypothetical protein